MEEVYDIEKESKNSCYKNVVFTVLYIFWSNMNHKMKKNVAFKIREKLKIIIRKITYSLYDLRDVVAV